MADNVNIPDSVKDQALRRYLQTRAKKINNIKLLDFIPNNPPNLSDFNKLYDKINEIIKELK